MRMIDRGMSRCVILMFDCDRSCLRVHVCGRDLDGEFDIDLADEV